MSSMRPGAESIWVEVEVSKGDGKISSYRGQCEVSDFQKLLRGSYELEFLELHDVRWNQTVWDAAQVANLTQSVVLGRGRHSEYTGVVHLRTEGIVEISILRDVVAQDG